MQQMSAMQQMGMGTGQGFAQTGSEALHDPSERQVFLSELASKISGLSDGDVSRMEEMLFQISMGEAVHAQKGDSDAKMLV